jgi:hypothetical protein
VEPPRTQAPVALPAPARSLGGMVRTEAGPTGTPIAVMNADEDITLVESTSVATGGYVWFLIRFQGGRGYHWGREICSLSGPVPGTLRVCGR